MRITELDKADIPDFLSSALELGINFFDHADIYGGGECEKLFAEAYSKLNISRDKIILQSKCGIIPGKMYDSSYEHIIGSVDRILKRLHTDYLDILLLHRPDALVEPEDVAKAFDELKHKGKVRYFGVSNYRPSQIELLKKFVKDDLCVNQMKFSIPFSYMISEGMEANMQTENAIDRSGLVLDYCRSNDITLQAWSPFRGKNGSFIDDNSTYPDLNWILGELAAKYNTTKTTMAAAWILRHPANIQIISAGTPYELSAPEHCEEAHTRAKNGGQQHIPEYRNAVVEFSEQRVNIRHGVNIPRHVPENSEEYLKKYNHKYFFHIFNNPFLSRLITPTAQYKCPLYDPPSQGNGFLRRYRRWKSRTHKDRFFSIRSAKSAYPPYDKQLTRLPFPYSDLWVDTSFGKTHLIRTGNSEGLPLLVFHGGNATTVYNLLACDFLMKDFLIYAVDTIGYPGKSAEVSLSPHNSSITYAKIKAGMPSNASAKRMARCTVPTLVMAGERDEMFSAQKVIPRAEKIIPNCTTYLLKDKGHMNFLTDEEKQMIVDFLLRERDGGSHSE